MALYELSAESEEVDLPERVRRVARPVGADPLIGARLRSARKSRGLTLDAVAEATELTKGFISRLERDEVSPSVASLVAVTSFLGIRVGELFDAPSTCLVTAGNAPSINFGGTNVEERLLTPGIQRDVQVIHSILEEDGNGGDELYSLRSDIEFVYVIRGHLEVRLAQETFTLASGDALTFSGQTPHTWRNAWRRPTEVLWVVSPAS